MKNLKKIAALMLTAAMSVSLMACGAGNGQAGAGNSSEAKGGSAATAKYKIGICQLLQHVALDAATQGFKDALTEKLGDDVYFDEQNASGEASNCATICTTFVQNEYDLILGNATAALQAAMAATNQIPVLGTSITDYPTALGYKEGEEWTGTTGINISGTSDLAPLDKQAECIKELFPDAKNIGILYCSGEPNSLYQAKVIGEALTGMGYTVENFSFSDSNDVAAVTQNACDASDVIYIPTDNTAASNAELICNVVEPAGVPVFAGEEGICKGCGVATLSINYYDLGYATGLQAYEILVNGADVSTMEVQSAPNITKEVMKSRAEKYNLTIPDDYVAIPEE